MTAAAVAEAIEALTGRLAGKLTTQHVMRAVGDSDEQRARRHLDTATATVGAYLGTASTVAAVPQAVLEQATLSAATSLHHTEQAPHGVANFGDLDATPVRVGRDPLTAARPLLRPFVGVGIA